MKSIQEEEKFIFFKNNGNSIKLFIDKNSVDFLFHMLTIPNLVSQKEGGLVKGME